MLSNFARRLATLLLIAILMLASAACGDQRASPTATPPPDPLLPPPAHPVLAFSAGGSVYAVDAAGNAPRTLIAGDRASAWAAAPALSPDGKTLLFTRGFDIWSATADGRNPHLIADVADLMTPPANSASNSSLGAQDVAFSDGGSLVAYVRARIGGSGDSELWTMRPDGSDRLKLYTSGSFISPVWIKAQFIAVNEGDRIIGVGTDATHAPEAALPPESRFGQRATPMRDNQWLVGSILTEQPIMLGRIVGPSVGMSQIAAGVSPTLSPDGRWVAYFWHDTLRVVSVDGSHDRQIADLAPLGGRDRHFAEQPECYPQALPACSYRPPSVAWWPDADTSALAVATPISPPRIAATPLVEVTGLFSDPRPTHVDEQRSLGLRPTTFAPWDGTSTMLYDVQKGIETNLAPGSLGRFSPDGTNMVWIANPQPPFGDGDVMVIDVASGARRSVGIGRLAVFVDNDHIGVTKADTNTAEAIGLQNGDQSPLSGGISSLFPNFDNVATPDGYELRREYRSDSPFPKSQFYLADASTGELLLDFEAYAVIPAGRGALAVATVPQLTGTRDASGYGTGTTNIFLVDIASGQATFVATSRYAEPNWPLSADDRHIIWTEDYCAVAQGHTRIYDRSTGRISEIDATLWPKFTPGGLILDGPFGGDTLIDTDTLEYRAAIPARGDTSWSRDYRYASLGQFGGHGGLCP